MKRRSRIQQDNPHSVLAGSLPSPKRQRPDAGLVTPKTKNQYLYINSIENNILTFGIGPAGTGKTWLAARLAARAFLAGDVERIVVTRPAVEAGESLGFLPGELDEKYEPYFRPVRDALEEGLGAGPLEYAIKAKQIEARPLALLRGSTFKNCWVILDEAQNTTPLQMKLFLTRIGENCKVIVNGDPCQKDIPGPSGLIDATSRLRHLSATGWVTFGIEDVVRSGIVADILQAYEEPASTPTSDRYTDDEGLRRVLRAA